MIAERSELEAMVDGVGRLPGSAGWRDRHEE